MAAAIVHLFKVERNHLWGYHELKAGIVRFVLTCVHQLDNTVTARLPSSVLMQTWAATDRAGALMLFLYQIEQMEGVLRRKPTADSNAGNVWSSIPELFITWGFNFWATVAWGRLSSAHKQQLVEKGLISQSNRTEKEEARIKTGKMNRSYATSHKNKQTKNTHQNQTQTGFVFF